MKKINSVGTFIVFVGLPLAILIYTLDRRYVKKNSVHSVLTVDRIENQSSAGLSTDFHYFYMGLRYEGSINFGLYDLDIDDEGARFYIMLIPSKPKKYLVSDRVPSWFTLDAPPEGWATKPTLADLRKLMVADSISRGLKASDTLSKE